MTASHFSRLWLRGRAFHFPLHSSAGKNLSVCFLSACDLIMNFALQSPVGYRRWSRQQDVIRAPEARVDTAVR